MKDKEALRTRYADLLDEQADAETLALIEQLDAAYATPEPPARLTLPGALKLDREKATTERRKSLHQRLRPAPIRWLPRRVGAIAAAVALAVALMAAGVYTAAPLISHLFDPDPGLHQVVQNPLLYQDVNASQTRDGFTLTVQKAYADANRVILSYTLTRADDPHYAISYQPILTTQDGVALRAHEFFITQTGTPAYTSFDAETILGSPKALHLRLTVGGNVQSEPSDPSKRGPLLTQPISVDFSVPFHPGRVANLHEAVRVRGKTLILERVVVTPSETRVYLRGAGYPLGLYGNPTLAVGDWSSSQLSSVQQPYPDPSIMIWPTDDHWPTSAMLAVNFTTSLMDQHGEWTLTVPQLGDPGPSTQGPWIFHFQVP